MKILIGYDGSEYGNAAIDDLVNAGLPEETEAVVISVGEAWELPMITDRITPGRMGFVDPTTAAIESHLAELAKTANSHAMSAVERIQNLLPEWTVSSKSSAGRAASELISAADSMRPDLVVVGSQGRSALGRFILGSVSQKVLNESRCSVRIGRKRSKDPGEALRVMIAVDGSDNAMLAVKEVAQRRWPEDVEIRLVAVNDPFNQLELGYLTWDHQKNSPQETEKSRDWIAKVISEPLEILKTAGFDASRTLRWGDTGNMILHEAAEWKADVIFLGARGLSRLSRFLLGSVSSFVAVRAECSVEVVREAREEGESE